MGALYNASPKIRGALPSKKLGAKNMQNSARFRTTSNFDREYLRNGSRYPKSENLLITNDSSRVQRRKSGELWFTNYTELDVSLNPPKVHFQETIFRPLGGAGPSNFNTLQIDQGLLAHTTKGDEGPLPKKIKGEHVKLGLKFRVLAPITLGV